MKKILFLSHSSGLGGAQKNLLELLEGLDREKYIPFVLLPETGPLVGRMDALGVEWIIYPIPWWFSKGEQNFYQFRIFMSRIWGRVSFLRKLIRDKSIDLVYTNTIACIDGGVAAKLEGKPHIWHIQEILEGNTGLIPLIPNFLIQPIIGYLADMVVVPSNAVKDSWKGNRFKKKVNIIPNGVDFRKFTETKNNNELGNFHEDLGIANTTKIVLLVGYFHEIKGQAEFLEAAKIVCDKYKDSVFVMVGEGLENNPYSKKLIHRSKELGVRHRIYFFGFREDIDRIINSADMLVSASWVESFSKVICEAMAASKPVIATRSGGPEDIVVEGETGFLVPKKNPSSLADAIIHLLREEIKAREMGLRGRKRVEISFRLDQYINKIERAIDEVYQRRH